MKDSKPILAILAIMLIVWLFICPEINQNGSFTTTSSHTVQQGDTLWTIACEYCPDTDPRLVIDEIERTNEVGEWLQVGQVIAVPMETTQIAER